MSTDAGRRVVIESRTALLLMLGSTVGAAQASANRPSMPNLPFTITQVAPFKHPG